jgi:hypothetical protein
VDVSHGPRIIGDRPGRVKGGTGGTGFSAGVGAPPVPGGSESDQENEPASPGSPYFWVANPARQPPMAPGDGELQAVLPAQESDQEGEKSAHQQSSRLECQLCGNRPDASWVDPGSLVPATLPESQSFRLAGPGPPKIIIVHIDFVAFMEGQGALPRGAPDLWGRPSAVGNVPRFRRVHVLGLACRVLVPSHTQCGPVCRIELRTPTVWRMWA